MTDTREAGKDHIQPQVSFDTCADTRFPDFGTRQKIEKFQTRSSAEEGKLMNNALPPKLHLAKAWDRTIKK